MYYLYGTSYNCGFALFATSQPFCGFKSYASSDLVHWKDQGLLFDASLPLWQSRCAKDYRALGCYRPHVLYNQASTKYILWINDYSAPQNYRVLEATQPTGPFVEVALPSLALHTDGSPGQVNNGDEDLFVDDDGLAYIVYTNLNPHQIVVELLQPSYESGTGSYVVVANGPYEAPAMFKRNGLYYVTYGPQCAYCNGTATMYGQATTPLGTFKAVGTISPDSCGGQPTHIALLPNADNTSFTYLYQSDLWHNSSNEGLANYFWLPLSFNPDGTLQPLSCVSSFNINLGDGLAATQNPLPSDIDLDDGIANFRTLCDISADPYNQHTQRLQTFVPTHSGILAALNLTAFQYFPSAQQGLYIDIVSLTADYKPDKVLHSTFISDSQLGWSPRKAYVYPNIDVIADTSYGILLHATTTQGCYGVAYNDEGLYPQGIEAFSVDNGQTFVRDSNRVFKVETIIDYKFGLPFVANNSHNFTTYLSLQNIGTFTASVNLSYYYQTIDGSIQTSQASYSIPALGSKAIIPSISIGEQASAIISSTQPLNVLVPEVTPFGGSAYTASSKQLAPLLYAPIAENNEVFSTSLLIFNTANITTTVSVNFYNATDGSLLTKATQQLILAPEASVILNFLAYITGSTIQNLTNQTLIVTYQYYDVNGLAYGKPEDFTLGPFASQGVFQGDPKQGLDSNFYGTALVSSSVPNSIGVVTNVSSPVFSTLLSHLLASWGMLINEKPHPHKLRGGFFHISSLCNSK
jgi:hypothetical protein